MVHNGIEYGDMQLIAEAYHLLKDILHYDNEKISQVFAEWNKGDLDSYLIEITSQIFQKKDEEGKYVVDYILDAAGQKGTGKWTATSALDFGIPVTLIGEAVFARCLSALKEERVEASKHFKKPPQRFQEDHDKFIKNIGQALYASKIISYAQGFLLLSAAAKEFGWKLNFGAIALMWRGGCIIRSKFLRKITEAYQRKPDLSNLLLDEFFKEKIQTNEDGFRNTIATAALSAIPVPAMSTALSYFDGYTCERLPANLLQAQRDFFGAHTYERIDRKRGEFFHTNWTGTGGTTASTTYSV
jgi:6-phosphogluconate dehydrogenase